MEYSNAMPIEIADLMREIGVYIRLVWLFVVIITALLLLLCCLYLAKRRSLARESASLEFSNLMIEGMETERRRVSRELHDNVLPQVTDTEVYNTIREICIELMPPDFTRYSLNVALEDLCNKFTGQSGIECAVSIDKKINFKPLGTENQLHLYRIVQEALTNIEKHSKAGRAVLTARLGAAENIVISVSDDGQGIQTMPGLQSKPGSPGLGMRGMGQRAAILGAKLDVINESGNGLMVALEIPNKDKEEREWETEKPASP
jgi:signal transduction histidine kinase